jgi:hypothetical protein
VIAVLLVVVGPTGRPDHDQQHCYHHVPTVNQFTTAVVAPDDGHEDARNMLRSKRQVINLRICCILLVDSVESMVMHGLANPKFKSIDGTRQALSAFT